MAFTPILNAQGKTRLVPTANSVTVTRGNAMVDNGSGLLTNAAVGEDGDIRWVAMETVTTTSSGQLVLYIATEGVVFRADTDAAWAQTDIGTYCDLASVSTLDPDSSTDDVFFLERGVGTAGTDTVVEGRFALGVPNS